MTEGWPLKVPDHPDNVRGPPGLLESSRAMRNDKVKFSQGCSFPSDVFHLLQMLTFMPSNRKRKQNTTCPFFPPCLIFKSARKPFLGTSLQRMSHDRPSAGGHSTCLSHQARWMLAATFGEAAGCWHGPSAVLFIGYGGQVFCGKLPAQALIN